MLSGRTRRSVDDGFSLIELLVTITLTAVVGAIVLSGLVQVFQSNARAQDRIDAFNQMQIAMERMTRELRAADPVLLPPSAATLSPTDVEVEIRRDGGCTRWRYVLQVGSTDLISERRQSPGCTGVYGVATRRIMVRDVTAFRIAYTNAQRAAVTAPDAVSRMTITITRALPQQDDVQVTTAVDVRNN